MTETKIETNNRKFLWVFGNAVQDITVGVDIERLSRELGSNRDTMIRLSDQGPEIKSDLRLKTQIGLQNFAIQMQLYENSQEQRSPKIPKDGWYILEGGTKYTLQNDIVASNKYSSSSSSPGVFLPSGNLSWGGGGVNVVTFLRAIAPNKKNVPIKYTDIAMSRSLPTLVQKIKEIFNAIGDSDDAIDNLYDTDLVKAEKYTDDLAKIMAGYAPECSLEVYLASLPVESVLYRPKEPKFRRNWVFSQFRSASREVSNKIILRGSSSDLKEDEKPRISKLLDANSPGVGAILLNSIKDKTLFQAAYSIYKAAYERDKSVVAILAMTDAMQEFTQWMLEKPNCDSNGLLLPFILVFNERKRIASQKSLAGSLSLS